MDLAGNDAQFLHGLLEGIARIERESYDLLAQLGATPVSKVRCHLKLVKRHLTLSVSSMNIHKQVYDQLTHGILACCHVLANDIDTLSVLELPILCSSQQC